MHPAPNGFVPGRDREPLFPLSLHKMLEYFRVCSALKSACDGPFGPESFDPELMTIGLSRVIFAF